MQKIENIYEWLILTTCQPVWGYFMTRGQGITYLIGLYLYNCVISHSYSYRIQITFTHFDSFKYSYSTLIIYQNDIVQSNYIYQMIICLHIVIWFQIKKMIILIKQLYLHVAILNTNNFIFWLGCPRGVVANVLDCDIIVHKFEHQSRYYVHFQINTLRKGMNLFICFGLNSTTSWPGVQSQVESYQRLKKWYLIPPCLTLSIIKYGSRVK